MQSQCAILCSFLAIKRCLRYDLEKNKEYVDDKPSFELSFRGQPYWTDTKSNTSSCFCQHKALIFGQWPLNDLHNVCILIHSRVPKPSVLMIEWCKTIIMICYFYIVSIWISQQPLAWPKFQSWIIFSFFVRKQSKVSSWTIFLELSFKIYIHSIVASNLSYLLLLLNGRFHAGSVTNYNHIVHIPPVIPFSRWSCWMPPVPISYVFVIVPATNKYTFRLQNFTPIQNGRVHPATLNPNLDSTLDMIISTTWNHQQIKYTNTIIWYRFPGYVWFTKYIFTVLFFERISNLYLPLLKVLELE